MTATWVLIVDDDADARDALADALEQAGYSSHGADNGREALALLERGPDRPFAILLDLAMPVMDGYEFRAAQKLNPAFAGIPVVLISGERHLRLDELAPYAVVSKPIDMKKLMEAIAQCAL